MRSILTLISKNLVKIAHDCSKGGLGIGLAELAILGKTGCIVELDAISNMLPDKILFSESHSRYILVISTQNLKTVKSILTKSNCSFYEF